MLAIIVAIAAIVVTIMVSAILYATSEEIEREELEMFKAMKYGAEGREVAEVQKLLQAAGSTIKVTGKYSIGMVSAVRSFQKKHGLEITGRVDLKTMNKLKTYAKPARPVKKAPARKGK